MTIYSAIDLMGGKVVRLTSGDYSLKTEYADDPAEVAIMFENQGAPYLHVVDLDGAKLGKPANLEAIKRIISAVSIPVQVGGGIRTVEIVQQLADLGVARVIIGTTAIKQPDVLGQMIEKFGTDFIVVSLDFKDGEPATEGWLETTSVNSADLSKQLKKQQIQTIIITDVDKDGMLRGPNVELMETWVNQEFEVIAAGGVTNTSDVRKLRSVGVDGAIIGKALYENDISIADFLAVASPNSLAKRIIPCMDIRGARVVKGVGFKQLKDSGDPLELARRYANEGADELVLLDIVATVDSRQTQAELVKAVAKTIDIPITVGGGIRTVEDIRILLNNGADKVSIGSEAVSNPEFVSQAVSQFGSQAIVVSVDPKKENDKWFVYVRGGRDKTAVDAIEFARDMARRGAGELLVNSLDRDGTKQGYDLELLQAITNAVTIPVIASSGVGTLQDFADVFIQTKVTGALAASVFHTQGMSILEVKQFLRKKGIEVRI